MFTSARIKRTITLLLVLMFLVVTLSTTTQPAPVQAGSSSIWSAPVEIENIDTAVAVTRSQDGSVHVIGVQNSLTASIVYTKLTPGASVWSIPESVGTTNTGGGVRNFDVVVTSDGRVHVVWDVAEFNQRWVQYAVRGTSGNWSIPETLSETACDANQVSIVLSSQGKIYVNWWVSVCSAGFFTRYQDENEMWLPAVQVDAGSGYPSQQQTLVDASGNVHYFWNDISGTPTVGGVYHRLLSSAGAWQPATKVSHDLFATSAWTNTFQAAIQGGDVYLVWRQYLSSGGDTQLFSAIRNAGVWSAAQSIENTLNSTPGFLGIEGTDWFVIDKSGGLLRLLTRSDMGAWTVDAPAWASSNGITAVTAPDKSMHLFLDASSLIYRYRDPMGVWADAVVLDDSASTILEEAIPYQYDLVWESAAGIFYSHGSYTASGALFLPMIMNP